MGSPRHSEHGLLSSKSQQDTKRSDAVCLCWKADLRLHALHRWVVYGWTSQKKEQKKNTQIMAELLEFSARGNKPINQPKAYTLEGLWELAKRLLGEVVRILFPGAHRQGGCPLDGAGADERWSKWPLVALASALPDALWHTTPITCRRKLCVNPHSPRPVLRHWFYYGFCCSDLLCTAFLVLCSTKQRSQSSTNRLNL